MHYYGCLVFLIYASLGLMKVQLFVLCFFFFKFDCVAMAVGVADGGLVLVLVA